MDLRPFRVPLWTGLLLLAGELALETRAALRGQYAHILSPFIDHPLRLATEGEWGPFADFPFRCRRVPPAKTPGKSRIWISSSSYAEDITQPAEVLFPNLLGQELLARGSQVEVLNASKRGYFIGSSVGDLQHMAPAWSPDVMLLYQMSNDIDLIAESLAVGTPLGPQGPSAAAGGGPASDLIELLRPDDTGLASPFVRELTAHMMLKKMVTARIARGRVLRDSLGPEGQGRFEALVRAYVAEARRQGATPVLATFASRYGPGEEKRAGSRAELQVLSINVELSLAGWLRTVDDFNAVLRHVAEDEGLLLIDVARELTGREELFYDLWHLTPEGHQVMARILAEGLRARLP